LVVALVQGPAELATEAVENLSGDGADREQEREHDSSNAGGPLDAGSPGAGVSGGDLAGQAASAGGDAADGVGGGVDRVHGSDQTGGGEFHGVARRGM
jgi:hypothetical protein